MSYSTDGKSDVYNVSAAELDNLIFNETKCDEQVTSDLTQKFSLFCYNNLLKACTELANNIPKLREGASVTDAMFPAYGYLGYSPLTYTRVRFHRFHDQ